MSSTTPKKSLALAMGTAIVTTLAGMPQVHAASSPFAMTELPGGYMIAENAPAEGKCGGMKMGEGMKAGDGKCGGAMKGGEGMCGMQMLDSNGDGKVSKEEFMSAHDAMFNRKDSNGDGVIDQDEMNASGCMKKPDAKSGMEGKCGAGMKM